LKPPPKLRPLDDAPEPDLPELEFRAKLLEKVPGKRLDCRDEEKPPDFVVKLPFIRPLFLEPLPRRAEDIRPSPRDLL
jgi:hypothetical protein